MPSNFPTAPGVYSGRSIQPRNLFASGTPQFFPSFKFIDGSKSRDTDNSDAVNLLRAGLPMGEITSGGKYAPSILGVLASMYDAVYDETSLTVPVATAAEIVRRIGATGTIKLIGPPTAAGTVATGSKAYTDVNTTTGVITLASAFSADFVAGSIIAPADGSEAPSQFVTEPYGLDVLDINSSNIDRTMTLLKQADINTSMIVFYSSLDASVQTWLKAAFRTNNPGAVLTFTDDR